MGKKIEKISLIHQSSMLNDDEMQLVVGGYETRYCYCYEYGIYLGETPYEIPCDMVYPSATTFHCDL